MPCLALEARTVCSGYPAEGSAESFCIYRLVLWLKSILGGTKLVSFDGACAGRALKLTGWGI